MANHLQKQKTKTKQSNNQEGKSPGEAEIQMHPAGSVLSPVPEGSMMATNLMSLLDNASTVDMQSSPVQKSPPRGFHQRAEKTKQRLIEKICMENHPAE